MHLRARNRYPPRDGICRSNTWSKILGFPCFKLCIKCSFQKSGVWWNFRLSNVIWTISHKCVLMIFVLLSTVFFLHWSLKFQIDMIRHQLFWKEWIVPWSYEKTDPEYLLWCPRTSFAKIGRFWSILRKYRKSLNLTIFAKSCSAATDSNDDSSPAYIRRCPRPTTPGKDR